MFKPSLMRTWRTGIFFVAGALGGGSGCSGGNGGFGGAGGDAGPPHCLTAADCAADLVCHLGICQAAVVGDGTSPGDSDTTSSGCNCTGRQICDPATGTCSDAAICVTDGDCVAPRVCVFGACEDPPACRTAADCAGALTCYVPQLECGALSCTTGADCPASLHCLPATSICVACLVDSDCPGTQVCPFGSCQEGPSCAADGDCLSGRVCTASACQDPSCATDSSEPNEDFAAATQIAAGSHTYTLSTTDTDMLFVPLTIGDGLLARATYTDALGDVIIEAYEADETWITWSPGNRGAASLRVEETTGAGVYIEIYLDDGICVAVALEVEVFAGGGCFNDFGEANDTAATASTVPSDPVAVTRDVELCPNDTDWYAVTIAAGATLTVTIATSEGAPPIAEAYEADGETLLLRDVTANPNKSLVQANTGAAAATYLLRLEAADAAVLGAEAVLTFDTQ